MRRVDPAMPASLNRYARELLEALAGRAEAGEIVLGGGVALSHYVDYRHTVDVDAWWRTEVSPAARTLVRTIMEEMATRHGLTFRLRRWGETESYELLRDGRKTFSFQVSTRTRYLDAPRAAPWTPLLIETFRDNVASKMVALVERGAPRDLRDIYEVCARGMLTIDECWQLWRDKTAAGDERDGRNKVLFHIERLELQRPLDRMPSEDRAAAATLRDWFRTRFCRAGGVV